MQATSLPDDDTNNDTSRSSPVGSTIELIPEVTQETKYDRQAILIEVDDAMAGQLETAVNALPRAVRDLYAGKLNIDHLEFFAWNLSDKVVFALTAYLAVIDADGQRRFGRLVTSDGELKEPLQTLQGTVERNVPDSLDVKLGSLPFGMFGNGPSVTSRIVSNQSNQKVTHADKVDGAGLREFLTEYADEPFLYYVHIRQNTSSPENFKYQLTVRISLFDPRHRISSASEHVSRIKYGRRSDPVDVFTDLGVTSSLSLIDDQFTVFSTGEERKQISKQSSPLGPYSAERDIITGDNEYDEIKRGGYGATNKLESIAEYTSVLARETDLKKFVTLGVAPSVCDPHATVATTDVRGATELCADIDSFAPDSVLIPVDEAIDTDDEIASQTPSTANDGTELHFDAIKKTALALKSDGYEVFIVTQDTGSRPDLWAKAPNGEIFAVEVESTTRSKAASVLTNIARQALWGYKTITVMVPQKNKYGQWESLDTIADWALETLSKPFYSREKYLDNSKTRLYNRSATVEQDGKTLLLPEGVDESEWWVTPDNRCLLLDGRTILAEGHMTDSLDEFEFSTPRYYKDEDTYIVETADGKRLQTCAEKSDIAHTCISPPHRPVDLSYSQYVEQLYCYDPEENQLVQYDMTADWDTPQASIRHENSHDDAFSTFVVDREGTRLMEEDCRPFIRDWIANLSAHGGPATNIYGQYRKQYYSRSSNNDDVGKIHHYPDASLRFDRGLVSPDLQGLSTKPSFIDEWEVDPDDVLDEPLIDGLDDRRHVGDTKTETSGDD